MKKLGQQYSKARAKKRTSRTLAKARGQKKRFCNIVCSALLQGAEKFWGNFTNEIECAHLFLLPRILSKLSTSECKIIVKYWV